MNKSREALGSADRSNGDCARVTSGNANFDKRAMHVFRKLIFGLCKQKKYESFQDMVSKVCAKTGRQVPQNLPSWNVHEEDNDSDCEIICQSSTESLSASKAAISTRSTPSPIVNPYKTSMPICTQGGSASVEKAKAQYKASAVIKNPYKRTVSTPTSSKPQTPVVTDTKPCSNTKSSSHSAKNNSLPPPESSSSSYKSPQQQTLVPPAKTVLTWKCKTCTFANEVKAWSRSRRRCVMCEEFA